MKTRVSSSRQSAFTLIELLVVISIIAILMGLLFPAVTAIIDNSNKAKASAAVRDIVTACNSYNADYGKFPVYPASAGGVAGNTYQSFGDSSAGKCAVDNNKLFNILRGINDVPNANHAFNPRQQKYINSPAAKRPQNPKGGFADDTNTPTTLKGCYMDPWGMQYCVILEMDGDQELNMGDFYTDLLPPTSTIRVSVAAFSMTKDGIRGARDYPGKLSQSATTAPDDVISWK